MPRRQSLKPTAPKSIIDAAFEAVSPALLKAEQAVRTAARQELGLESDSITPDELRRRAEAAGWTSIETQKQLDREKRIITAKQRIERAAGSEQRLSDLIGQRDAKIAEQKAINDRLDREIRELRAQIESVRRPVDDAKDAQAELRRLLPPSVLHRQSGLESKRLILVRQRMVLERRIQDTRRIECEVYERGSARLDEKIDANSGTILPTSKRAELHKHHQQRLAEKIAPFQRELDALEPQIKAIETEIENLAASVV